MSTTTVARWAKARGVPLRPQGGKGGMLRFGTVNGINDAPAILRPALESNNAWLRLQRFTAAADYPTIKDAARSLGISYSSLLVQISRLELDLGEPLHTRAQRGGAMAITDFGIRVMEAVREMGTRGIPA